MKMRRIFAAILCVVMIAAAIPTGFAAGTTTVSPAAVSFTV